MRLCVFCGSSAGASPHYAEAAARFGRAVVRQDIQLVYGGGRVGLMGVIADAVLAEGGEVIGVIPRALVERELAHEGLTTLHIVESMHDRKRAMAELSHGFVALPGGVGTLEELFEQWTWAQLGIHDKPCGLLNVGGYFDPLITMINRMIEQGFLDQKYVTMLLHDADIDPLLTKLRSYDPPSIMKWTSRNAAQIPLP
jgi:uncharacterized protein (TIGR00730 family)